MVKSDASSLRRVLTGTAIGALIGLVLAVMGYAAWWMLFARYQAVSLERDPARIERLLESAAWIPLEAGEAGASPVYVVGHRGSAETMRYLREQAPMLTAAGREVRVILFAPEDAGAAEQATVAELWLRRDARLFGRWTAASAGAWTAAGLPVVGSDLARSGVVEAGRRFATDLSDEVRRSGGPTRWPLVFWSGPSGGMNVCACDDARSWGAVAGPGAVAPGETKSEDEAYAGYWNPAPSKESGPQPLPYPNLPPPVIAPTAEAGLETRPSETAGLEVRAPIQRSEAVEAVPATPAERSLSARPRSADAPVVESRKPVAAPRAPEVAPQTARRPPEPTTSRGRRAPEARRQDDSLFF